MKISSLVACACLLFPRLLMAEEETPYALQEGDIVFSSSSQGQGKAIMEATGSRYTHCGMVQVTEDQFYVLEAVQPVRVTPLATFISHSDPGTFTAKRLKTALSLGLSEWACLGTHPTREKLRRPIPLGRSAHVLLRACLENLSKGRRQSM